MSETESHVKWKRETGHINLGLWKGNSQMKQTEIQGPAMEWYMEDGGWKRIDREWLNKVNGQRCRVNPETDRSAMVGFDSV